MVCSTTNLQRKPHNLKRSNNPLLSALNCSSKSSGSHTYLTSWLNSSASSEIEFPEGIERVVFDNEQIIGKRYRVKTNQSTVPASAYQTVHICQSTTKAKFNMMTALRHQSGCLIH